MASYTFGYVTNLVAFCTGTHRQIVDKSVSQIEITDLPPGYLTVVITFYNYILARLPFLYLFFKSQFSHRVPMLQTEDAQAP